MNNNNARFSIIIPTYNRKAQLIGTLKKLSEQTRDASLFEVVVIDDGSDDGTAGAVSAFREGHEIDINLISQKNKGPASARNVGIEISKYKCIIFLDSDCYPLTDDWLLRIDNKVNNILSTGSDDFLLAGRIVMPSDTFSQRFIMCLDGYGTPDLGGDGFKKEDEFISFPTTNLIVPKKTFKDIGGFDENIIYGSGEDTDFCYRLWKSGRGVFTYDPSILICHLHRTGILDLAKMSFRRSVNHYTLLEKYGIFSKRCFRRRLIKMVALYMGMVALLVSSHVTAIAIGAILFAMLFFVFLLRTKNVFHSVVFPFYYLFLSVFEVAGSTIGVWIYIKNRGRS